jgi:hypothetical protein
MALTLYNYLNLVCAVLGIAIFIFCILNVKSIIEMFPNAKMTKKWKIIQTLIIFFLVGYLLNIIFVLLNQSESLLLMQALVYLFGALFVYIVVDLSKRTFEIILESANKE